MLATFEIDSMGSLIMLPVSKRWKRRIIRHLSGFGIESDGSAFEQIDTNIEALIWDHVPVSKRDDLAAGWPVTCRVDPWAFLHVFGYDAHTLAE